MKRKIGGRSSSVEEALAGSERANTLEAFIGHLHEEGVEAGRQEAARIRDAAAAEAATIVANAEQSARQLISDAEKRAHALLAEGRSELALAVRDAQLELRDKLGKALTRLLQESLERELSDPALLRELLREIVGAYVRGDGTDEAGLQVRVRPEVAAKLAASLPAELGRQLREPSGRVDLQGTLRSAGLEYSLQGTVIEITSEAVAEKLGELITPQLRALLRQAAGEQPILVPAGVEDDSPAWTGTDVAAATGR